MAERPYETRTVTADIELRDGDADAPPQLTGYAATFGTEYRVGHFMERLEPDAFKRTLANNPDVRLLIDHEGQPLARTKSGTLTLSTDHRGLSVNATLDPADPDVQRLLPKMRRKDLDQMSFAFRVPPGGDSWDYSGDVPKRSVREASLSGGDVSVVTYPANEDTQASVRAIDELEAAYTLADAMLREVRSGNQLDPANVERLADALQALGIDVRAQMSTSSINDLPDSDFAYIEPGGKKDDSGKTTPRSLRHFPIHDAAHVRNALARIAQGAEFGDKALPAVKAAAKKFGIDVSEQNSADTTALNLALAHATRLRLAAAK